MKNYQVIIGLEIHAELKTESKMFCGCLNDPFTSEPNSNICPVCTGQPGALPVPNKKAILWTFLVGKALNATLSDYSKFDRKHYFYPDLPKGYQISQYDLPFCQNGKLKVLEREIGVIRVHLEEDTGKLVHPAGQNYSLLDLNRAGVPLLELVTAPEIKSAQEARVFCENYQELLRDLKVASADMEKGEMRCEANISVQEEGNFERVGNEIKPKPGRILNPKVEVKNLNSFRSVERAIEYEIKRQTELLEAGESPVQETRGWNDARQVTVRQREKESAHDYRYFPEPDIPPISQLDLKEMEVPVLSSEIKEKLLALGVTPEAVKILIRDKKLTEDFLAAASLANPVTVANLYINRLKGKTLLQSQEVAYLANALDKGEIPASVLNQVVEALKSGQTAAEAISKLEKGGDLLSVVRDSIAENPEVVASYKKGKTEALSVIIGTVMRKTKGMANAKEVREILENELSKPAA